MLLKRNFYFSDDFMHCRQFGSSHDEQLKEFIAELARKNIIRAVDTSHGLSFVRVVHNERGIKKTQLI